MEQRKPSWAKKVPQHIIKKLYEQDAKGIYDEELIDEVGAGLYARVDSILMVTSSNLGKAICIECRAEIPHNYNRSFLLVCPECNWSMLFGDFNDSYKKQTLNGYGALSEFKEFYEKYPSAKNYMEKILLIDRLIHTFHGNMQERPSRPVASNVIDGSNASVANLIYTLAYGENSTVAAEELDKWLDKHKRSIHYYIDPTTGTVRNSVSL